MVLQGVNLLTFGNRMRVKGVSVVGIRVMGKT